MTGEGSLVELEGPDVIVLGIDEGIAGPDGRLNGMAAEAGRGLPAGEEGEARGLGKGN